MAGIADNHHVAGEKQRLEDEHERGQQEGYAHGHKPMPAWFRKPYVEFTAYEQGFAFGNALYRWEVRHA